MLLRWKNHETQVEMVRWWCVGLCLLQWLGGACGAARFLSHVPHEAALGPGAPDTHTPDYEADVKIPGRHYPKTPYRQETYQYPGHTYGSVQRPTDQGYQADHGDDRYNHVYDPGYHYEDHAWTRGESYHDFDDDGESQEAPSTTPVPGPHFDRSLPRTHTVQAGKTARLSCRVFDIQEKSVSWMRVDDLHILSVGKYKYSTDNRVSVLYDEPHLEWVLQIAQVTERDAGMYECQISTKPVLSFLVNMDVVDEAPTSTEFPKLRDEEDEGADQPPVERQVPSATIVNGPEIFVHRGSLINLTCIVDHTTERPLYVVWYHYDKVIDYEAMGSVVVVTQSGRETISNLLVRDAAPSDSGKYTCKPSNGEDATVQLHVLDGEHPAAMQTNTSARIVTSVASLAVALTLAFAAIRCVCNA